MKVGALVFYDHPAYSHLAENAIRSFSKWHPDIQCEVATDTERDWRLVNLPPGFQKTLHAESAMAQHQFDKLIVLGADTITCARLTEFLEADEDILHTLDYSTDHPFGYNKPQVNADVVCFNNIEALKYINKLAHNLGGPFHEQGAQNISLYGMPKIFPKNTHNLQAVCKEDKQGRIFVHGEPEDPEEVKERFIKFYEGNQKQFTHKIIDYPGSNVVYNARSKEGEDRVAIHEKYQENISSWRVSGDKLLTRDGRHIKVFHYCEGLGARRTNKNFRSVVEKYMGWFNEDTIKFFMEKNDCTNMMKERKYPKWNYEDKYDFDEYVMTTIKTFHTIQDSIHRQQKKESKK